MRYVKAAIGNELSGLSTIMYDAEAIFALRDVNRRALSGRPLSDADARLLVDRELGLARECRGAGSERR